MSTAWDKKMNPWQKESLNLKVGDWIIWQDIAIQTDEGTIFVTPGIKGQVVSFETPFALTLCHVLLADLYYGRLR